MSVIDLLNTNYIANLNKDLIINGSDNYLFSTVLDHYTGMAVHKVNRNKTDKIYSFWILSDQN